MHFWTSLLHEQRRIIKDQNMNQCLFSGVSMFLATAFAISMPATGKAADSPDLVSQLKQEIAQLRAENEKLRQMLEKAGIIIGGSDTAAEPEALSLPNEPAIENKDGLVLGITLIDITPEVLEVLRKDGAANLPHRGPMVKSVVEGSPAHKGGMESLDVIVRINGILVHSVEEYSKASEKALRADAPCTIQLLRLGRDRNTRSLRWEGKRVNVTPVKLAEIPAEGERAPIALVVAYVDENSIGQPRAWVQVTNCSTKNVVAIDFTIECLDRFDRPVHGFGGKSNRTGGIMQQTIRPRDSHVTGWTLHGHDTTAKVRITVDRVKLSDGREWVPEEGKAISVIGESRE